MKRRHNLPIRDAVYSYARRVYCVATLGLCSFQRGAVFYRPVRSSRLIRKMSACKGDRELTGTAITENCPRIIYSAN